jgi:exopolyphosphatase/guanosine-5'-triphosphate,3'-diphosphate pyrophosphatase
MDVGTNTVRLLLAEAEAGRITRNVLDMRANTRLGEGLRATGEISPEAAERTLVAITEFAEAVRPHGPDAASVIGTEAIRRAGNSGWFVGEIKRRAGLDIEIISGEEEARRMLIGVRAGVGDIAGAGPKLVIDIGGGSTELVATDDFDGFEAVSVPIGAVTLLEDCVSSDPPSDNDLERVREHAHEALAPYARFFGPDRKLVGTAGTITTLAAIELGMTEYDPARITGHAISRDALSGMIERFKTVDAATRCGLPGLETGREDIIISGAILLGVLMDMSLSGGIIVSDYGLREGNLLYLLDNR